MNSEEFLQKLKDALVGKVSDQTIQENVSYYRSYISKQISTGISETQVLESLGDPRLLAKTIVQSSSFADEKSYDEEPIGENTSNNERNIKHDKTFHLPGFVMGILLVLVMMVVIGLAFCMIRFLAPVIILWLLGVGIYKFIKKYIS